MMPAKRRDIVPGTIPLVDLEHCTSQQHDIVLNPRPSADPEDPLNWPVWRKQLAAWMIYTYIFGVGIATTVQYSMLASISEGSGIPIADLNTGTGLLFLFAGWGFVFWQPIALVFGRRGVYILSSLLVIGPMVWTAYSKKPGKWYAYKILIGFIIALVESLPEVSIPDLFFAHDAIYTLFVFGSNALAPFFAVFIFTAAASKESFFRQQSELTPRTTGTNSLGWLAAIWFGTILLALTTVVIFVFLEDTIYFRETIEGVNEGDAVSENELKKTPLQAGSSTEKNTTIDNFGNGSSSPSVDGATHHLEHTSRSCSFSGIDPAAHRLSKRSS